MLRQRLGGWVGLDCGLLALALGVVACAHPSAGGYSYGAGPLRPPALPPFLGAPMVLLLTNSQSFGAHVTLETWAYSNRVATLSGELFGRGSKFLFVAEPSSQTRKARREGGDSFIWDAGQNGGYVLNEALQGYAPLAATLRFTNLVVKTDRPAAASETIEGHRCEPAQAAVASSDGSVAAFQVWRATDLKGFPLRIQSVTNSSSTILHFSAVRFQPLPEGLFLPPEGFAKYASVDAMFNELLERRASLAGRPAKERDTFDRSSNLPGIDRMGYR